MLRKNPKKRKNAFQYKYKSKIVWFEPIIFLFFGVFHLHRIWGLFDRSNYAKFWLSIMSNRGCVFYVSMAILSALCIAGIVVFVKKWVALVLSIWRDLRFIWFICHSNQVWDMGKSYISNVWYYQSLLECYLGRFYFFGISFFHHWNFNNKRT